MTNMISLLSDDAETETSLRLILAEPRLLINVAGMCGYQFLSYSISVRLPSNNTWAVSYLLCDLNSRQSQRIDE